ncbi:uncharacterized protein TNCV_4505771 [Trichonephila clavipes]|nr:uncharacterized protein TNCV_4505771 [Trichonephila clavipes]
MPRNFMRLGYHADVISCDGMGLGNKQIVAMQTMFSLLLLCVVAEATVPDAMRSYIFPGNINNEDRPATLQKIPEGSELANMVANDAKTVAKLATNWVPKMMPTWLYRQNFAFSLNCHYNNREEEVAGAENLASRLQSSIEEAQRNYDQGDVSSYMFSQPIQQAQCYVEVQVTHRHPGRCIRLGGQIPACRSNEYLHVNYQECS